MAVAATEEEFARVTMGQLLRSENKIIPLCDVGFVKDRHPSQTRCICVSQRSLRSNDTVSGPRTFDDRLTSRVRRVSVTS